MKTFLGAEASRTVARKKSVKKNILKISHENGHDAGATRIQDKNTRDISMLKIKQM